ncbi:hypothetical protein SLEP1_g46114 [Rubroshorea leprosula]|uniref:Retrovirus-related Pol polyprotein from transposon TNT 1-94 n=1 Tax=Rubroshorea leprosula TaxID=152421 RepID=A0AAV5LL79_9ROSI|nr:hypothetical protein SLEP1_g46114 [Rubroshorea leprosula]
MEDKLFCKDLYDPIEHKGIKPAEINDADWKKIDRKAYGVIRKWIDMSVIHHMAQEKESYKLWTKLEELFERKNALKKASLIRKLVNLKYNEGKNVSEHLNNFQEILNKLVTVKLAIDDEVRALILLSSLPDSWETLVVTLSNSTRDGEMTLQLVKDSILREESRRKEQGIMSSESEALVTEYRGRSKQRDKNVRKRADTHEEKEAKENTAAITSDGEVYLLCENDNIDAAHHDSTWVVDTAASYHVTPNRDWFSSYKEGDFGYLKMGNRSEAKIVGVGDVWLETNIGSKLHLKNVRHVPEIRLNLMSTDMLDDDGYLNYFGNGTWKLTKGIMDVARGKKRFSLYETQAKQCQGHINVTEADATELWHKRLGHLSEKGLQILSKKDSYPTLQALKTTIYLINRSLSVVLNGDVPKKVWSGKEVSYKHLKVFGCKAYVHVPKEERAKLDAKTKQCVFLGYGDEEYGYRLWDLKNRKLMRTRDVVFIENETVEDSKKQDDSEHTQEIPDKETHQEEQVQSPQQPQVRRSTRLHQPSRKYSTDEYVLLTDGGEPETYYEAMESGNKKEWLMAMQEEMSSLQENGTYELGFGQQKVIDYDEIFSPAVKMPSIRAILALAASLNLEIEQLDVKTAFLHGDLEEEIYMKQPEGFEVQGKKNLVCKLKKSLYGLKQAPRQWCRTFDSFMREHKFARTEFDHCVYVKRYPDGDFLLLLLYVDDMLIVGHDTKKISVLKTDLSKSFSMKDLGPANQILGMKIFRDRKNKKLWLSQEKYIEKVLDRFNMSKAKPVGTPLAGHFKLSTEQCPASKEEAKYMKNVPYASAVGSLIDADLGGDLDFRKSTSGYLMLYAGGAISWKSKLQKSVSLSTTEAEYIAFSEAGKEIVWMKMFFEELGLKQERFVLFCDNQSAIYLNKNPQFHSRTKHVDLRYHWIRDAIEEKVLDVEKVHTDDNSSDMMTKSLVRSKFEFCKSQAGLVEPPN